jgi:hypothetical protein
MRDRSGRLERMKQCRERLGGEAVAAATDHALKLVGGAAHEDETGRKSRGREPKPMSETQEAEAKANVRSGRTRHRG